MSYDSLLNKNLELNVVVRIGTDYFAVKEPDSGLSITSEFLQVKNPRVNGVEVDIRKSNTPIGTFSFKLMEFEGSKTSSKIMLDETQYLEKDVTVYLGHVNNNFDFADYLELTTTKITSVTKIQNGYSIISKEVSSRIAQPALNLEGVLKTALLDTSTTLSITSTAGWPSTGFLKLGNEYMAYASLNIDGQTFDGLSRGIFGSTAVPHELGVPVLQVTPLIGVNPVDMILQILLSKDGDLTNDPTYDVLEGGLGIPPENVNITEIENIRDTHFQLEAHTLYISEANDMMQFLEKNLLPATNLRFVTYDGKISLSLLDQVDFNQPTPILDEDSIVRTPTWGLTSDKVVNVIEVFWDFNPATEQYESDQTFEDADSIATFGRKKPLKLLMPSVTTAQNGANIAQERAGRLLSRLSTARGKVTVKCHFDKSNIQVSDAVQLVHRYLPQQGGTLGISDQLEVMSRSIDLDKAIVTYKLEFTSYTGIRIPFIGPSPKITNVISQSSFEVDDASCLAIGERHALFKDGDLDLDNNPTAGSYLPDSLKTIESIVGNVVTFSQPWTSTLEVGLWLKLPDYDQATEAQRAKYAFIGENTGFFSDGSKSYQIIF